MNAAASPGLERLESKIEHIFVRASGANMTVSEKHLHKEWEAIFVLQGTGHIQSMSFPNIALEPGKIVCIPPYVSHTSIVKQPYRSVAFRVSNYELSPEAKPFWLFDNATGDYRMLASMMVRLYVENAQLHESMIRHLIYCMLDYIRLNVEQTQSSGAVWLERVKQQICENFHDPNFDLAALIDASGYSRNYFCTCFTKLVGVPPHRYLQDKRLEYAVDLLKNDGPSIPVKDVAYRCGFTDPQYFSRVFKNRMGVAPSALTDKTL